MNTWSKSKNISSLDTKQDTVMGRFEKGVKGNMSFWKAATFCFFS